MDCMDLVDDFSGLVEVIMAGWKIHQELLIAARAEHRVDDVCEAVMKAKTLNFQYQE